MRRLAAISLTGLALGLAACGGDDAEDTATPPPATNRAETAEQPGTTEAGGQQLFATTCAGCHTLAAAGAQGRARCPPTCSRAPRPRRSPTTSPRTPAAEPY
jgi:mono/diheme cytochrome c family protein